MPPGAAYQLSPPPSPRLFKKLLIIMYSKLNSTLMLRLVMTGTYMLYFHSKSIQKDSYARRFRDTRA